MIDSASSTPSPDYPVRKRPAHMPVVETSKPIIVFLTICTHNRKSILACDKVHQLLRDTWIRAHFWQVGRYVIMPNHIHLFAAPACWPVESIRKWSSYWKSHASRRWPNQSEQPIWQTDGWDTQLRSGESYSAKWEYVRNNPVRAGLVNEVDDWPYQGEINPLSWH
ncbi:MAG: hypothetical protein QM715_07340 [Nibricoccus sp.]